MPNSPKSEQSLTFRVFGKHGPKLSYEEFKLRSLAITLFSYRKRRPNAKKYQTESKLHPKVALWLKLAAETPQPQGLNEAAIIREKTIKWHKDNNIPLPENF